MMRNRYNQVPHLTLGTNMGNRLKHNTQESEDVSPIPASDQKVAMYRQRKHNKDKYET